MFSTKSKTLSKIEPYHYGLIGLALMGTFIAVYAIVNPNIDARETSEMIKEQRTASDREVLLKQVTNQSIADQAPIALERFERGCLLVADRQTNRYVALANGSVSDPVTGLTLIDGSAVCDVYGMTGIVTGGVVAETAFNPEGFKSHPDYNKIMGL
ncbi:hypothetical protein IQ265_06540 [Nodosilinea sp. LEGE 06152]|uniref:hypothetical protein n=1 Tax=Nodosilinea sp. LEGE 06152 TaxID=2777966 RepID=UPI001880A49C|nr:hypothetical protein [Nodosilinea sp. LEGE 06152]MBE9156487.1 hypothetical protein [Nodosilinea sp. LEGE 06152]